MRSSSCGQLHSRERLRAARARPSSRRRSGPGRRSSAERRGDRRRVAALDQQPGLAVVDHRAHARVVGGDRRQAAGHRLDQDDPERLRRLGGEQEEVGGAQDARAARRGGRRRGSGPARRPRRLAACARKPSSSSPPPATTRWTSRVAEPRERLDRDVEPLEVVGAVEGGDERGDDARRPGSRAARGVRSVRRRGRTAPRRRRSASRSASPGRVARRRAQVGDRVGVVGREHADPVGGADQRRRDRVLVGLEQRPARARCRRSRFL